MSVTIREVIEAGGYDLTTVDDANWLLAQQEQFAELVEEAEDFMEEIDRLNEVASEEEAELEAMQERADEERRTHQEDGEAV